MADDGSTSDLHDLLNKLSQNEVRLGESISAITQAYNSLEMRVRALETKEQSNEVIRAREDERDKALYDRLGRMEEQINETRVEIKGIKSVGSKALWIVGSAVLTAVVTFVVKGGLA